MSVAEQQSGKPAISLKDADFRRTFRHPEHPGILTIDWLLAMYEWHGRHHVGHITSLRDRKGW